MPGHSPLPPAKPLPLFWEGCVRVVCRMRSRHLLFRRQIDTDARIAGGEPLLDILRKGIHESGVRLPLCLSLSHDLGPGGGSDPSEPYIRMEGSVIRIGVDFSVRSIRQSGEIIPLFAGDMFARPSVPGHFASLRVFHWFSSSLDGASLGFQSL